jgi:hypothetical protein
MKDNLMFKNYMTLLGEIHAKELSDALKTAYWATLSSYSDAQCKAAFEAAIARCKFFPKPAELLEFISGPESDQATLAWLRVDKAVRTIGNYESIDFADDRAINSTIEAMGGWVNLCMVTNDEWKWKRKEFETLYPTMQRKADHPEHLAGTVEIENVGRNYDTPKVLRLTEKLPNLSLVKPRKAISEGGSR